MDLAAGRADETTWARRLREGDAALAADRLALARGSYTDALEAAGACPPTYRADPLVGLAKVHQQLGELEAAEQRYASAAALFGRQDPPHVRLGAVPALRALADLQLARGDAPAALASLESARSILAECVVEAAGDPFADVVEAQLEEVTAAYAARLRERGLTDEAAAAEARTRAALRRAEREAAQARRERERSRPLPP